MRLEQHNRDDTIILVPLFFLLILNTMARAAPDILQTMGDISTDLTFAFALVFLIRQLLYNERPLSKLSYVYIALGLLAVLDTTSLLTTDLAEGSYLVRLLLFYLFILWAVRRTWKPADVKMLAYTLGTASLFIFIHWVQLDMPAGQFASIFRNQNYLAVLLFVMLYFKLITLKYGNLWERIYFSLLIVADLLLIYATGTRSVLLAMIVIIGGWIIVKVFPRLFSYLFYIVLLGNALFIGVYTLLVNTVLGDFLNSISVRLLGKNLFSGRAELWEEIFQAFLKKPLFGYGLKIGANDVTSFDLSAHNQYLQILLETGALGLVVFLVLLFGLWKLLMAGSDQFAARLSACFLLGIMVYENFEITLFQNDYSIALFQWLIMIIGIGFQAKAGQQRDRIT